MATRYETFTDHICVDSSNQMDRLADFLSKLAREGWEPISWQLLDGELSGKRWSVLCKRNT